MAFHFPPFFRASRKRPASECSTCGPSDAPQATNCARPALERKRKNGFGLKLAIASSLGLAAVSGAAARDLPSWYALLTETELLTPKDWAKQSPQKPTRQAPTPVPVLNKPIPTQPTAALKATEELLTPRKWQPKRPQPAPTQTTPDLLIPAAWTH